MSTTLAPFDTTVRLAIQRAFIEGRSTPTVTSVAGEVSASIAEVRDAFERLATGHVIVLATGTHEIVMSAPFAGGHTDFSVTIGPQTYQANCIWDALGVSAMLAATGRHADAEIRTLCADCAAPLAIAVRDGAVYADPGGAVAHFAVPAARWWADIGFT